MCVMTDQAHPVRCIDRDDRRAAGVMDDLQVGDMPIGQSHRLDIDGDDPATKYRAYVLDTHVFTLAFLCKPRYWPKFAAPPASPCIIFRADASCFGPRR